MCTADEKFDDDVFTAVDQEFDLLVSDAAFIPRLSDTVVPGMPDQQDAGW